MNTIVRTTNRDSEYGFVQVEETGPGRIVLRMGNRSVALSPQPLWVSLTRDEARELGAALLDASEAKV